MASDCFSCAAADLRAVKADPTDPMTLVTRERSNGARRSPEDAGLRGSTPAAIDIVSAPQANDELPIGDGRSAEQLPALSTHRVVLIVASIGLFGPALIAWTSIIQLPVIGTISTAACAAALLLTAIAAACRNERGLERLDVAIVALGVVVLGAWATTELYFRPAYGTDEAAFVQYAAQLLMHGHDPYRRNLLPALTQFRVPIQYATYRLNGSIASNLAYPALSFLLVVPGTLLTHGVQSIIIENAVALAIEMVLVFAFLPKRFRALSVVIVLGLSFLFDYTIGGDIITMAMPFLLVVSYRWTAVGRDGRLGSGGVIRALCLGLAVSICQFPWFVVPFLAIGMWQLRSAELGRNRGTAVVCRYFAIAAGVALAVNVPFIAWTPRSWLSGILAPLFQGAIPFGQGLIDATAFLHIGGGNLGAYTGASMMIFAALLTIYSLFGPLLRKATFILPSVVFLFSTRSLSEYFIMMVAMWVVGVISGGENEVTLPARSAPTTPDRAAAHPRRLLHHNRHAIIFGWLCLGAFTAATLYFVDVALSTAAPFEIRVQSMESNGQFRSIWRIRAQVVNRSTEVLQPHFATDGSGYMTTFWNIESGPRRLLAHHTSTYVLVAPNVGSMPGVTQPFVLQAVTSSPNTISSSPLQTPEEFSATVTPSYVDHFIPLGHAVSLRVQLRSPYGAPIRRAGVRIALGQVIYAQDGLIAGEAQINGAPEGRSPVVAMTNATGEASFRVADRSVQGGNPLYFQAYVNPRDSFPYGYSEVVSIQWQPGGIAEQVPHPSTSPAGG